MTCCFFSSFKTLLTMREDSALPSNQCPGCWFDGLQLAGFHLTITGRFWVSTEAERHICFRCVRVQGYLLYHHLTLPQPAYGSVFRSEVRWHALPDANSQISPPPPSLPPHLP